MRAGPRGVAGASMWVGPHRDLDLRDLDGAQPVMRGATMTHEAEDASWAAGAAAPVPTTQGTHSSATRH